MRTNPTEPIVLWGFNPNEYIEVSRPSNATAETLPTYQDPITGECIVPLQHVNLMNIHNIRAGVDLSDVTLYIATGWYFEVKPVWNYPGTPDVVQDSPWAHLAADDSDRLARLVATSLRANQAPFSVVVVTEDAGKGTPKRAVDVVLYGGKRYSVEAGLTAYSIAATSAYDPVLGKTTQSPRIPLTGIVDAVRAAVAAEGQDS